jgi:phospholipid/cholesterol/gamma-HCH transport system substrate-binding protein
VPLLAALAVLAVGAGIALAVRAGGEPTDYRVDVVFDNARGLLPGQLVQIAGGRVGTIHGVRVTDDFKARVELVVDERFAPFREDARCTIRPQGLLAENYVQCNPGSAEAGELRGRGGEAPTVPVERTSQPVNLTDLFEIWNVPTRDRLTVLVDHLGIATAARGEDLNAILRRGNPALARAKEVIDVLVDQRDDVRAAIRDTDATLASLAPRSGDAQRLVRSAAAVLDRTARHDRELALAIERLPGMLASARPTLERLGETARTARPLLAEVHRSVPAIDAVARETPALARAARPTIRRLAPVLDRGTGTVRAAAPLARALRVYARQSLPSARIAGELLPHLDERGFTDNLMRFFYYATLATARFDDTSHILPAHIGTTSCSPYAETPQPGCSANFTESAGRPQARSGGAQALLEYLLR